MRVKLQIEAQFPVMLKKEGKYYIACCPILDVLSQGRNIKEAKKNLAEAIHLFFITCYEQGTLDEALKECGFEFSESPVGEYGPEQELINVQIPFIAQKTDPIECHA